MILIITHKFDFTADFVIQKLNEQNISFVRLNCEDIPVGVSLNITSENKFLFEVFGISNFKSIWFRRTKLATIDNFDVSVRGYFFSELDHFQKNLWQLISGKWLSHPDFIYRAENKLLQLRTALSLGFSIPKTLASSDCVAIRAFHSNQPMGIIIKPIFNNRYISSDGGQLIYTSIVKESDLDLLDESLALPSIYQEYISKEEEVRVTVVDNEVFSAGVYSQNDDETKIDWRKKKLPFHVHTLPAEIQEKCLKLVNKLGLSFGAIDLIRTLGGEYVFLEINPNGQWAWVEIDTGLPISNAIIKFLNS